MPLRYFTRGNVSALKKTSSDAGKSKRKRVSTSTTQEHVNSAKKRAKCPSIPQTGIEQKNKTRYVKFFPKDYNKLTHAGVIGSKGNGPGQFRSPADVSVTPSGIVVVTEKNNCRVQMFHENGRFYKEFGSYGQGPGEFLGPNGIDVDQSTGNIYISDDSHQIFGYDCDGLLLRSFGCRGDGAGELLMPSGLVADPESDSLYVADHGNNRVAVFDKRGNHQRHISGLDHPVDITLYKDKLYVTEGRQNTFIRIAVIDASGDRVDTFCQGETGVQKKIIGCSGILADPEGRIIVTDYENGRVQALDSESGVLVAAWGGRGRELGCFNGPLGLALSPTGTLLVLESTNARIQLFK